MLNTKHSALAFIVMLGLVSLFADVTYEGSRSITGPFLATLGANALMVGFVSGFGEFVGYALRIVSGYIADKTKRYWFITFIGYTLNLIAVPLLALTYHWWMAGILIVLERTGKAIRTPARDAMLSHAGHQLGMGKGFGLHETLDKVGAMVGPLFIATVLWLNADGYRMGFAYLAIPAGFAILLLILANQAYPNPSQLEVPSLVPPKGITSTFWFYLLGSGLIAAGFADYPLIAYHFEKAKILTPLFIPIAYSLAMGVDGLMSYILGSVYDRYGFIVLIIISLAATLFSPLVFLGNEPLVFLGVILWAIGVGAQSTLMRAIIGNMIPHNKRGTAYGIFNTVYGSLWLMGSVLLGFLYDISIPMMVVFSVVIQLIGVGILYLISNQI